MIRNLGIGALSGLGLLAVFLSVLTIVASCDGRDDWGGPIVAQVRAAAP